jgi:hypothetical protein
MPEQFGGLENVCEVILLSPAPNINVISKEREEGGSWRYFCNLGGWECKEMHGY